MYVQMQRHMNSYTVTKVHIVRPAQPKRSISDIIMNKIIYCNFSSALSSREDKGEKKTFLDNKEEPWHL